MTIASTLIDYVSHDNWTRPNVAQREAIVAGEILEEIKVTQLDVILAHVPTSEELEEITNGMPPAQGLAVEDAMSDLSAAVQVRREQWSADTS